MDRHRRGYEEPHPKWNERKGSNANRSSVKINVFHTLKVRIALNLRTRRPGVYPRICRKHNMWRGIEVVITGLTRNQFEGNLTRVRIPPSPPNLKTCNLNGLQVFLLYLYSCKAIPLQRCFSRFIQPWTQNGCGIIRMVRLFREKNIGFQLLFFWDVFRSILITMHRRTIE